MAFSVNDISSALQYGGARPSLFSVQITNPASAIADVKVPFMVQAASIPTSPLGAIPVAYFGRHIKVAGTSRQYDNWQTSVINDEDYAIRSAIEQWSSQINSTVGNIRTFGSSAPQQYKSQAQITHYGQAGNIIAVYTFYGLFPLNVGAMETNWNDDNTIQSFQCEWAYDYFTSSLVDSG